MEEIIHKQTRELQALKSELITEKEESAQKLKDNEAKWLIKQTETVERLNNFEADRKKASETYQSSLAQLKVEHELENKKQNEQIQSLIDNNKLLTQKYDSEVGDLKKVIEDIKAKKDMEDEKKDKEINLLNRFDFNFYKVRAIQYVSNNLLEL